MNKRRIARIALAVILVLLAVGVIAGPVLAALVWHHDLDDGTKVTRVDMGPNSNVFQVYGFNAAASFGGHAEWYKDCDAAAGVDDSPRVFVKQKGDGDVQVICVDAEMTPTVYP